MNTDKASAFAELVALRGPSESVLTCSCGQCGTRFIAIARVASST